MTPCQESKHKDSIFVIHDETANLKVLLTILTEHGYAVHHANEGELRLQLQFVKHTLPDLVLVDVRMPGMDGYQVCASLKNDPITRTIPVIFISSIFHLINQGKALLSGAVDYMPNLLMMKRSCGASRPIFPCAACGRTWNPHFASAPGSRS